MRSSSSGSDAWGIAEECPVEIGFNGAAWTVMMATPSDIEDLAIGLALTEGALLDPKAVTAVDVRSWPEGITADIQVDAKALDDDRIRRRALDGRTGCGLCGVETLADIHRPHARPSAPVSIQDAAIGRAMANLPGRQTLNSATHSVHAAAWCSLDGEVLDIREDVGRHNALDKLAGARLRSESDPAAGFVLMSSRCSFELVFKAARLGACCLVSLSAPTGLALDLARALQLPLACRGPGGDIIRFNEERQDG